MDTAHEHRRHFGHPCPRAVNTTRDHDPWTRAVCTGLQRPRTSTAECLETCVFIVEACEGVDDDVLGVSAAELVAEQREEHGEVDWTRRLLDHCVQLLVGWVLAERRHHLDEVVFVNEAVAVLVDHVERLLCVGRTV